MSDYKITFPNSQHGEFTVGNIRGVDGALGKVEILARAMAIELGFEHYDVMFGNADSEAFSGHIRARGDDGPGVAFQITEAVS